MKKSIKVLAFWVISILACTTFAKGQSYISELKDFKTKIETADKPLVVVFIAPGWCVVSKRYMPIVNKVAKDYEGKFLLYYVDIDKCEEKLQSYVNIDGVPVTLFFKNGVVENFHKSIGIIKREELIKILKSEKFFE